MNWLISIADTITPLTIGIGIIGAGIGAVLGTFIMHLNRNSPFLCGTIGGVLFWLAWRILFIVTLLVCFTAAAWWIIRNYDRIRQELLELASLLHLLPDPSRDPHHFDDRLADLAEEHDDRLASISRLFDDDDDMTKRLSELENKRYRTHLIDLFRDHE